MLEVKNISVYYGQFLALSEVSLHVERGETVAVMGPNGSGKTTLLKALSGMIPPKTGSITYDGTEITKFKPYQIASLGIVHIPEGKQIFSDLTVAQNLKVASMASYARKKRDDSLEIVLRLFPILKERTSQKAGTLSGGERQMLAIGMGFMNSPKMLLLDEPSQGLAPRIVIDLFGKIRELCEGFGIGILLVEQQARLSIQIASRGYLLINGRISFEGKTSALMEDDEIKRQYLTL